MAGGFLTVKMVRDQLQDRTPGDNSIDCDLFWSDEEIVQAMDRAAAAYNTLPPRGVDVRSGKALPADVHLFMDAVLSQLYGMAIHKLARNIMSWQTGDVTVDLEKTRMEAFKILKEELTKTWKEDARDRKADINRSLCWRYF